MGTGPALFWGSPMVTRWLLRSGYKRVENWSVIGQQIFLVMQFEACDVEILR